MGTQNATEEPVVPEVAAWLGMTPLFILEEGADTDKAITAIRNQNTYSVFYVLGEQHITGKIKENNVEKTVTTIHPRLFKVVTNLVGNAVSVVDNTAVSGLKSIDQIARFTLPKIPYDLIREVDGFFREIYKKHGTEAIVIFTYDKEYLDTDNPEDGWGIVVPKQKNTAGSCDYDPISVVDMLPDDPHQVTQVGTAHSHPGMSAYCSGVDKADQSEFDGIHITFGWSKNSYTTEWHVELQMGGSQYTMEPEQTFSGMPQPKDTERIQEWAKNVTKKHGTTPTNWQSGANAAGNPTMGRTTSGGGSSASSVTKINYDHLPKDLPEPSGRDLIVSMPLLNVNEIKDCPVCLQTITHVAVTNGKCNSCNSYIIPMEIGTIDKLMAERTQRGLTNHDLDMDDKTAWKSVWLWEERVDDNGKSTDHVARIREGAEAANNGGGSGKADGIAGDNAGNAVTSCPNCFCRVAPGEEVCEVCDTPVNAEDVTDIFNHVNNSIADRDNLHNIAAIEDLKKENFSYMICCDQDMKDCKCPSHVRISFGEIDDLVEQFADIQPYKIGGGCEECVLRYTVACEPYRGYLADFMETSDVAEMIGLTQIDPCSDFTLENDMNTRPV